MKLTEISVDDLHLSSELRRSGSAKAFEDRLVSSISAMGLAEPLKVAPRPEGGYVVIDGTMRLQAIRAIRADGSGRYATVPAYVLDYSKRFEIRFQTDIYQDLLPSQMAALVEHLHKSENVLKADIARYIGVSPATLRNYTGLWRLLERGGLFRSIVDLMDVGVIPSSNPYAWLRLTADGLHKVLTQNYAGDLAPEMWIKDSIAMVRNGGSLRFPISFVDETTGALPPHYYREDQEVRSAKRDLGLRKGAREKVSHSEKDVHAARKNLTKVATHSSDPILRLAAKALQERLA